MGSATPPCDLPSWINCGLIACLSFLLLGFYLGICFYGATPTLQFRLCHFLSSFVSLFCALCSRLHAAVTIHITNACQSPSSTLLLLPSASLSQLYTIPTCVHFPSYLTPPPLSSPPRREPGLSLRGRLTPNNTRP